VAPAMLTSCDEPRRLSPPMPPPSSTRPALVSWPLTESSPSGARRRVPPAATLLLPVIVHCALSSTWTRPKPVNDVPRALSVPMPLSAASSSSPPEAATVPVIVEPSLQFQPVGGSSRLIAFEPAPTPTMVP